MQQPFTISIALFCAELRTVGAAMLFKIHFANPSLGLTAILTFSISKEVSNFPKRNLWHAFKIVGQLSAINHRLSWATATIAVPVQHE